MPLGAEHIYLFARHAGFSPDQAVTMTAIAMAESGGNVGAHNPHGEDSRGLWQVNLDAHPKFHGLDPSDPLTNARMAFEVSGGGTDIGRWTVTHGDKGSPYLQFRDQAEAASRAFGENGHGQWNPPANYHAPKVGAGAGGGPEPPAQLPTVVPDDTNADFTPAFGAGDQTPASPQAPVEDPDADIGQDSDQDGLLDRYEKAIGTDANSVDSDRDGFSDRDELVEFGTDPTEFGSNPLGATSSLPAGSTTPTEPAPGAGGTGDDVDRAPQVPASSAALAADPGPQFVGPATNGGAGNKLDVFLDAMLAQDGDTYVFGAEVSADEIDPDTFDCSEIIEWAGDQAGVDIPDGSFNQYLHAKSLGAELTVEEALRTPGAMLFKFSSTPVPGGGRPKAAHVAISLGDGRTIEARSTRDGVGIFDAGSIDWTHGGFVPDLGTEVSGDFGPTVVTEPVQPIELGADSDEDGLLDAYERMIGTDPFNADTDRDGFIDSQELSQHGSDPLDFTDNALTPGSSGGFRPPLTTDLPPGAKPPPPFGGSGSAADDVGLAPGSGPPPLSPGTGPSGSGSGPADPGPAEQAAEAADAGPAEQAAEAAADDAVDQTEDALDDAQDAADDPTPPDDSVDPDDAGSDSETAGEPTSDIEMTDHELDVTFEVNELDEVLDLGVEPLEVMADGGDDDADDDFDL